MPLGIERLNERTKRPNDLINFIRPLRGTDEATSRDYLERIAAICYPVMKANHVAVMALEEFPPNREFWGRNFNAGEVIQLVLKSLDGRWLPFKHVQMVMMHELAHCKQMNHSKSFWQVRNSYADHLHELWQKGYTGEGLWGKGRGLADGTYFSHDMPHSSISPATICGGVYESRKKRKRKDVATTLEERRTVRQEQKRKRILKKFGTGGSALGADEDARQKLEGTKVKGKPKVAASQRARELRAAAALARYEKGQDDDHKLPEDDSETESEYSDGDTDIDAPEADRKLMNPEGANLIRVCRDGADDDAHVKQEMADLEQLGMEPAQETKPYTLAPASKTHATGTSGKDTKSEPSLEVEAPSVALAPLALSGICGVCSFQNDAHSPVCDVCSNVLLPHLMTNHWRCTRISCKNTAFINSGDNGICSVCGTRRP